MPSFVQEFSEVEFDTSIAVSGELVGLHVWATVTGELTDEGVAYSAAIERVEGPILWRRDRRMLEGEAVDAHLGLRQYRTKTTRLGRVILGDEIKRKAA